MKHAEVVDAEIEGPFQVDMSHGDLHPRLF